MGPTGPRGPAGEALSAYFAAAKNNDTDIHADGDVLSRALSRTLCGRSIDYREDSGEIILREAGVHMIVWSMNLKASYCGQSTLYSTLESTDGEIEYARASAESDAYRINRTLFGFAIIPAECNTRLVIRNRSGANVTFAETQENHMKVHVIKIG
ncbi:MAG: hypothetical protein IJC48_03610, partial [Clostridia bacterium]|nr:hypothetical protein [Clostridia bacterium]